MISNFHSARGRLPLVGVVLVSTLVLTGCSGAHLYNAEKDEAVGAALAASNELSLQSVVTQTRQNQAKLLNHELAVVADFAKTRRDVEMQQLLLDPVRSGADGGNRCNNLPSLSGRLDNCIGKRLDAVFGTQDTLLITNAANEIRGARENLRGAALDFRLTLGVSPPACTHASYRQMEEDAYLKALTKRARLDAALSETGRRKLVDFNVTSFRGKCLELLNAQMQVAKESKDKSLVKLAAFALEAAKEEQQDQVDAYQRLSTDLDKEIAALGKALKPGDGEDEETHREGLNRTLEEIKRITDAIKKIPHGEEQQTTDRIAKIDAFLQAAATGNTEGDAPSNAEIIAAQIPGIVSRVDTIRDLSKQPPVFSLVLQKELLQIQKRKAQRGLQRQSAKIALLEKRFHGTVQEGLDLVSARQLLTEALALNGKQPIETAFLYQAGDGDAEEEEDRMRALLLQSLATYLSTFEGPRRQVHEDAYRLIDIDHASALDGSLAALETWEVSVKQPVAALAAYHATGLKTENLVELLKAVGLFAIAVGEND